MLARDVMTANPATVDVDASPADIEALLHDLDVRHVPVLNHAGALSGIISDRDLAPFRQGRSRDADVRAGQIMTKRVLSVGPDTQLSDGVDTLLEQKVGALLVVDATSALVDIVSYIDILRAVRDDI
jgi:acetoin utilization protein AcuB